MQAQADIVARLDRLERENRRWKLAFGPCLAACTAACFASFQDPPAKELVAERFVLQGPDGEEYATLEMDGNQNPMLQLRKEKSRAALTLSGPGLLLRGPDGVRSAFLGIDTRGATKAELTGKSSQDGLRLVVQPDGAAGVYALDARGYERAALESLADGHSSLSVRGERSEVRGILGLDPKGNSSSILLDGSGRRRIGMVVQSDGTPTLSMEDEKARPRANLTMEFDGSPHWELLREDGKASHRVP